MGNEEDSSIVTFRTGEDEVLFEALEDMVQDEYFESGMSGAVREALSDYLGGGNFPRKDFELYVEARRIARGNEEAREEILDEKFFSRAVNEMLERGDSEGLRRLNCLYEQEKY